MSQYSAELEWQRAEHEAFVDNRYSRKHLIRFDGGIELAASASPSVVPLPYSDASAADPEELFVASLASCHMLWFLALAAEQGWRVDRYVDHAVGTLARDSQGRMAMTKVCLRPEVRLGGDRPKSQDEQRQMHERAHERCFIASSVRTELTCEPVF